MWRWLAGLGWGALVVVVSRGGLEFRRDEMGWDEALESCGGPRFEFLSAGRELQVLDYDRPERLVRRRIQSRIHGVVS